MLAFALSRRHPMVHGDKCFRSSAPPNTPTLVIPDVSMPSTEAEADLDDGIDFGRVRAELDRLLEEGLQESDHEEDEAQDSNTIDVA
ncbi:unnamed protein product [Phytophthora lilii]|uniref:Unnamed protein product n=1 Tax=Phytophthora lilii TaxID=2077276 RepID=A0A9W6TN01_9STRA|nr:unnamed protein product [Phytophthora lilii]